MNVELDDVLPSATIMVGTVVTSSNSTIRSFIKATNARIFGRVGALAVADTSSGYGR